MAPKNDFVSDWQLECGQIRERAGRILKMEHWTDCSFLVGDESEQVEVKTHKLILAMASPVFEAMFYGPIAEGNGPILIPDMQPVAFKALLEYIYTDNIEIGTNTLACDLYYGAQKYMLPQLQTVCIAYLSSNLTTDLVCSIYEFALMVGEEALVKDCENMIKSKTVDVLKGSSFLDVQLDTVVRIFSMHPLNVENELVMIRAAEQYNQSLKRARTAKIFENAMGSMGSKKVNFKFTLGNDKKPVDISQSAVDKEENGAAGTSPAGEAFVVLNKPSSEDGAGVKGKEDKADGGKKEESSERLILKLMQKIDFLTLSSQQLAEEKSLISLLTNEELLAVIMNVSSAKTYMPMPAGFSTIRIHRRHACQISTLLFGQPIKSNPYKKPVIPSQST